MSLLRASRAALTLSLTAGLLSLSIPGAAFAAPEPPPEPKAAQSSSAAALAASARAAADLPRTVTSASEKGPAGTASYVVQTLPSKGAGTDAAISSLPSESISHTYSAALQGFSANLTDAQVTALKARGDVVAVTPDAPTRVSGSEVDPPWGLDRIDQRGSTASGNDRYVYDTTGIGVWEWVIDTGIRSTHSQLAGRVYNGYDWVDDDYDASDCHGHGTHVSGTTGGTDYGVAKDILFISLRVWDCSGSGSFSDMIAAVDYAVANKPSVPSVINISGGGGYYAPMNQAVANATAAGIPVVVAAGNDSWDACNNSPASAPGAVTVAATDITDTRSHFSNYGSCVDIFAPGSSVLSSTNSSDYSAEYWSGTSMATPHVSGVLARLMQTYPYSTPGSIVSYMLSTATTGAVIDPAGSPNRLSYVQAPVLAPEAASSIGLTQDDVARGATMTWSIPAFDGGSPITGYRVGRDGIDASGEGPWTTVLPADRRSQLFKDLAPGNTYTLYVQAVNAYGTGPAEVRTVTIAKRFSTVPTPTISGTPKVASTLTAIIGSWSPTGATMSYQWKRAGVAISGATAKTYKPTGADAGKALSVTVTGAKAGYLSVTKTSAPVTVALQTLSAPAPVITGTTKVNNTLTAIIGTWGPAPVSMSYQWKRDGVAISGATGKTYLLVGSDSGKKITVTVTGKKTGYSALSKTTASVTISAGTLTSPTPYISGTLTSGSTLTAYIGTWTPSPVSMSYQWKRNGVSISGATAKSYTLTTGDKGKTITVTVTGKKTGYTTLIKTTTGKKVAG